MSGQGYAISGTWKGLLADVGVDHTAVLRIAGLPEDLLNRDVARVTTDQFLRFSEALDSSVRDPEFWVRLTEAMSPEWFSPPVFAALCSPDLTTAAARLARFKPLMGPVELTVDAGANALRLTYRWAEDASRLPAYLYSVEAMFVTKLARLGTRHRVVPAEVVVPQLTDHLAPVEAFLGAALTRGRICRVTFSEADARRPFLTANGAMWNIFEPELRQRLADLSGDATFTERTRSVLLEALPGGQLAMHQVARRLAVSTRTLQRRLRDEDTSFKDLVQETRHSLALHYLRQTQLTSTEIAYLLGFEEPTSFFRAFQRWTGCTPETVRQRRHGDVSLGAPVD